jgi:hypothetical protein
MAARQCSDILRETLEYKNEIMATVKVAGTKVKGQDLSVFLMDMVKIMSTIATNEKSEAELYGCTKCGQRVMANDVPKHCCPCCDGVDCFEIIVLEKDTTNNSN